MILCVKGVRVHRADSSGQRVYSIQIMLFCSVLQYVNMQHPAPKSLKCKKTSTGRNLKGKQQGSRVSTQDIEEDPNTQTHEKFNEAPSESQEEVGEESEKLILPQRMINLQRDLTTSVSNNQTAADAKESMRRNELEESRKIRSERLKNNVKSSEKIFQEITTGWSKAKQKVIPQELQEALNNQQQLCAAIIKDKKKLLNDLQQELKVRNDQFVKDLRKQEENLDLTMESFENEIQTLTLSYKEELAHILVGPKSQSRRCFKSFALRNLKGSAGSADSFLLRSCAHKRTNAHTSLSLLLLLLFSFSLQKEIKTLRGSSSTQKQEFQKTTLSMSKDHKRSIEKYENVKRRIKHFALADARQYEDMWLTVDEEVRQLADRALAIDSQICELVLGAEEGKISAATLKKVLELLCDKAGFLVENKLLNLLAPLEEEEQTVVKLASLLCVSPRAAMHRCNVAIKRRTTSRTAFSSRRSALKRRTCPSWESSARLNEISCDPLDDEAYWERMGNIIPEDRVKLWDVLCFLCVSRAVLKDISEVVPEIQSLEKENRELRMLLQQHFP
uniref:Dynein regulatory complex protein 1 n=1 Tax=Gasterosteus aculeatus aculeatus TaxID=481459 RepID=A0AAQ4RQS3_GASAC